MNRWDWRLFPEAEAFLDQKIDWFMAHNDRASNLAKRIEKGTSTMIFDWIDHIVIPSDNTDSNRLTDLGFKATNGRLEDDAALFQIEDSVFFPILLSDKKKTEIAISTENLEAFRDIRREGWGQRDKDDRTIDYGPRET